MYVYAQQPVLLRVLQLAVDFPFSNMHNTLYFQCGHCWIPLHTFSTELSIFVVHWPAGLSSISCCSSSGMSGCSSCCQLTSSQEGMYMCMSFLSLEEIHSSQILGGTADLFGVTVCLYIGYWHCLATQILTHLAMQCWSKKEIRIKWVKWNNSLEAGLHESCQNMFCHSF